MTGSLIQIFSSETFDTVSLDPGPGLMPVTEAALRFSHRKLVVLVLPPGADTRHVFRSIRSLFHELVVSSWEGKPVQGGGTAIWFLDDSEALEGCYCREPGLRVIDLRS